MFYYNTLSAQHHHAWHNNVEELLTCFQPRHGAMHNGHMKLMDLESRAQRSSDRTVGDDIDLRNDETFGDGALGIWLFISIKC